MQLYFQPQFRSKSIEQTDEFGDAKGAMLSIDGGRPTQKTIAIV